MTAQTGPDADNEHHNDDIQSINQFARLEAWSKRHLFVVPKGLRSAISRHNYLKCCLAFWVAMILAMIPAVHANPFLGPCLFLVPLCIVVFPPSQALGSLLESLFWNFCGAVVATGVNFAIFAALNAYNRAELSILGRSIIQLTLLCSAAFWAGWIRAEFPTFKAITTISMIMFVQALVAPIESTTLPWQTILAILVPVAASGAISLSINMVVFPLTANDILRDAIEAHLKTIRTFYTLQLHHFRAHLDRAGEDTVAGTAQAPIIPPELSEIRATMRSQLATILTHYRSAKLEVTYGWSRPRDLRPVIHRLKKIGQHVSGMRAWMKFEEDAFVHMGEQPQLNIQDMEAQSYQTTLKALLQPIDTLTAAGIAEIDFISETLLYDPKFTFLQWCRSVGQGLKAMLTFSDRTPNQPTPNNERGELYNALQSLQQTEARIYPALRPLLEAHQVTPLLSSMRLRMFFLESLRSLAVELGHLSVDALQLEAKRRPYKMIWFPRAPLLSRVSALRQSVLNTTHSSAPSTPKEDDKMEKKKSLRMRWQAFVYRTFQRCTTISFKCGIKTALGVLLTAAPAFFEETNGWYTRYKGSWAVFTVVVVTTPNVGGTLLIGSYRMLGTVLGAVWGALAVEAGQGSPYVIMIFAVPLALATFYVQLFSPYSYAGLIACATFVLCSIYPLSAQMTTGFLTDPWALALQRTVAIASGILIVIFISWTVFPSLARKHIRLGAAKLTYDISIVMQRTLACLFQNPSIHRTCSTPPIFATHAHQNTMDAPAVQSSAVSIASSIDSLSSEPTTHHSRLSTCSVGSLRKFVIRRIPAVESQLVNLQLTLNATQGMMPSTRGEPGYDGPFDQPQYAAVLAHLQLMIDLVAWIRDVISEQSSNGTRRPLTDASFLVPFWRERREVVGSISILLQLISFSIQSRSALPAFLPSPRLQLGKLRTKTIEQERRETYNRRDSSPSLTEHEDFDEEELPVGKDAGLMFRYHAYAVLLYLLVGEVEKLGRRVGDLFGRDEYNLVLDEHPQFFAHHQHSHPHHHHQPHHLV